MTVGGPLLAALARPAVELRVSGTPGPQGSKKATGRMGQRVRLVESSAKVKPWRDAVVAAALAQGHRPGTPTLDGPLIASFVFTLRKPTSAPKRRRTWPAVYPDVSKLLRSTEDALTSAGVWADDARLVEVLRLAKVYPGEDVDALDQPGVLIRISPHPLSLEGAPA